MAEAGQLPLFGGTAPLGLRPEPAAQSRPSGECRLLQGPSIDLLREAVERRAREIWAAREVSMPKFVRQSWEQGTYFAQRATLGLALEEVRLTDDAALRAALDHLDQIAGAREG